MSLTQRKSEPPSPTNQSWKDIERGLGYPADRHWSKSALSEYDHKSSSAQAVLSDAAEGD
jgi:hypothetical protein